MQRPPGRSIGLSIRRRPPAGRTGCYSPIWSCPPVRTCLWTTRAWAPRPVYIARHQCRRNVLDMYSFAGGCSKLVARPPAFTYQFNIMSKKKIFTLDQAKTIGEQLGVRWDKFDVEQFRAGLGVELEHGTANQTTNVTNGDPLKTAKIPLAHLT